MIVQSQYSISIQHDFNESLLNKGTWLVILHACRIPPHIGVIIDGNYNSLTIKGQELNISSLALVKTIQQKKIETLFIQLKYHPVFSTDYQKEICQYFIKQYKEVKQFESTCLNPVKQFLQEFYALPVLKQELMFELIERLKQNEYIDKTFGVNLSHVDEFYLPVYTQAELQDVITKERLPFYND